MKKTTILIGIGVILAVSFLVFWAKTADNQGITQPTSAVDMSGWKTYRNENIGIEFRYPSSDTTNVLQVVDSQEQIIDRGVEGDIYIAAYPFGQKLAQLYKDGILTFSGDYIFSTTEDEVSYSLINANHLKESFNKIVDYGNGFDCSKLKINTFKAAFTPSRVIEETCRVLVSDYGVKMITELYAGYSGPHFHALFLTKDYTISFIISELWRDHSEFSSADGFDKQEIFSKRIFNGEFLDITKKIEKLESVLRTIRLIQK